MKRAAVTLALLGALVGSGCGVDSGAGKDHRHAVQRFCEKHGGGVLSTDWHGDTVVCADQRIYDQP